MDKYYQLLDRDPAAISPIWKACHIFCFALVSVSGFIASYSLGKSEEYFGNNCVLFASIKFQNSNINATPTDRAALRELPDSSVRPFNMSHTQWGSIKVCNFCQFTSLCSTIFSLVWCAIFILCSRGGAGYMTDKIARPWRLVYPAMIFVFISTAAMLGSLLELDAGIKKFCAEFEPVFNTTSCVPDIDIYTLSFSPFQRPLYTVLQLALSFNYICFLTGLIHLCIMSLRIVAIVDFQMIRITVSSPKPKKKIIDFLEPEEDSPTNLSRDRLRLDKSTFGSIFIHSFSKDRKDGVSPHKSYAKLASEESSLTGSFSPSPKANDETIHPTDGTEGAADNTEKIIDVIFDRATKEGNTN